MATGDFLTFDFTDPSGFRATVTVTEAAGGGLTVTVTVDESGGVTGDLRALYFDTAGAQPIAGLTVSADAGDTEKIALRQDPGAVRHVGSRDTNINGQALRDKDGGFDAGVAFGSPGRGKDDVQTLSFTLTADAALTLGDLDFSDIALRVTSVGAVDGPRDGSLKLTGEDVTPPPPDGEIGAVDDFDSVSVDALYSPFNGPLAVALGVNALDNDAGTYPDSFLITAVTGANGTFDDAADPDGWFDWVDGDAGGEVRVSETGALEFRDIDLDFGPALAESAFTAISYEVSDKTGATDDALIVVEVLPADEIFD